MGAFLHALTLLRCDARSQVAIQAVNATTTLKMRAAQSQVPCAMLELKRLAPIRVRAQAQKHEARELSLIPSSSCLRDIQKAALSNPSKEWMREKSWL